jgi:hypothetical protein
MIEGVPFGIPVLMVSSGTGDLIAGLDPGTFTVMVSLDGGAFAAATGTMDEYGVGAGNGSGFYTYMPHVDDVVPPRFTLLVTLAGYFPYSYEVEVEAAGDAIATALVAVQESLDDMPAAVVAAANDDEHDTGASWAGLKARLEALASGAATGLNRSGTVTFLMRDGTTAAFTLVQDVAAGTRGPSNITGSEPELIEVEEP